MAIEFTAFPRSTEGRGASRRMRRAGKAPGIVYGGVVAPTPIELDHNALFHALRNEAFHASILTMKLDGSATQVLLRDVQMHPFRNEILHVDFQRVDAAKKIHMKVPLHFVNGENSPAVKISGAIVSHVTTDLDVSCLPKDLPEFIEVDLATLEVGHSLHVSALKLPEGVKVVTRGKTDPVVAAAIVPRAQAEAETEAAPAAEAAAAAAPAADAKAAGDKGAEKKDDKKEDKKK
jgi:large subunit ribosomal protein L25